MSNNEAQEAPGSRGSSPWPAYFLVIGRGISGFGAVIASFSLDVWVFQTTGSYEMFALLAVLTMVPGILLSPLAGVWIDRLPKRLVLLGCESVSLAVTASVWAAYSFDVLNVAVVAAAMLVYSIADTIRWPTLGAAVALLATAERRPRVNGVAEACRSLTVMCGPAFAAAILHWSGLGIILTFTAMTSAILLITLFGIHFDEPRSTAVLRSGGDGRFWLDLRSAVDWLRQRPNLCRLLGFFAISNFAFSVFVVSQTPYVLSFSDVQTLSWCFAADGLGVLAGGLVFARLKPRHGLNNFILWGIVAEALTMVGWSLARTNGLLFLCAFGIGMLASVVNAASQTVWQSAVPADYQGRIFSLRFMVVSALAPVAILLSVPLSQTFLVPVVNSDFPLMSLWGTGQPAALGVMVATLALIVVASSLLLWATDGLSGLSAARIPEGASR